MGVPLLDLKRQYASIQKELEDAVLRVCRSQYFILGPEVEAFEHEIAEYCGAKYALGVSSGTDALLLALMALDIGPGDEVITSPYSFFATAGSIARVGATSVFVDVERESLNLDPALVEARITKRTKAILPVHIFGQCAEMKPLREISRANNIPIIEDAAQAIGAEYCGQRAGTIGDIGCFSFFPSKNLGAFGDGGLVTTNSEELHDRMRMLRVHGGKTKYHHDIVGGNFRLDALQAAVLRIKLKYLDAWTAGRIKNAQWYSEQFTRLNLVAAEKWKPSNGRLCLPVQQPERRHIFNQFVIRVEHRDPVLAGLRDRGIGCEVYYPVPLHLQKCFSGLGYDVGSLRISERAAQETLALPVFPELTQSELEEVVSSVAAELSAQN